MITETLLLVFLLLAGGWFCWHHGGLPWWKDSKEIPGPWACPVLGNIFHLFHPRLPIHLTALAKQYGPIYRLRLWNKDLVILNSLDLIREALLKKRSDFAGRPHNFIADLVSCGGKDLSLGTYTPTWQLQRRLAHIAFQRIMRGDMEKIVQNQAQYLCKVFHGYKGEPIDVARDFSLQTCWVVCTALFGPLGISTVKEMHDCTINLVKKWNAVSTQIVGSLPFLRAFPNITLRPLLLCLRFRDTLLRREIKKHQESCDSSKQCDMVTYLLQFLEEHETGKWGNTDLDLDHIHMIIVDMLVGGTETTSTLLTWTVAFLLHHPQIQEKIHEELMTVVGSHRDPTYSDRENLPYLTTTIMETLRLRPSVPLALPHVTICDTRLAGFSIPKGTTVIPNLYGAHHDESQWDHPLDFRPERFLEHDDLQEAQRHLLPFSCGSRVCLGESLARMESFLFLAHLLRDFQILPPSPGCLPDLKGRFEFLVHCPPFMVRLVPRTHAEPVKGEIQTSKE